MANVNDQAPNFELKNTKKEPVSLDTYKGKTVVLAFYPGAFTGVCDTEMCTFNDNLSKLNDSNATAADYDVNDFPSGFLNATNFPGGPGSNYYCIPMSFESYIVFYNKDIFSRCLTHFVILI